MDFDQSLREQIERTIDQLGQDYQNTQGLILSEGDLKCLLFDRLLNIERLSENEPTYDPAILGGAIHTELKWYDKNKKLTIQPDISIISPNNLSILHGLTRRILPSKQFEFHGEAIIFELKFIRDKKGITQNVLNKSIKRDYQKIMYLFERLKQEKLPDIFCYFVIFNKTDNKCNEFCRFIRDHEEDSKYKYIYKSGKVEFPPNEHRWIAAGYGAKDRRSSV